MRLSCALLLLCLISPASAGLFNRKKNGNDRRRLTENPQTEDWDTDASTGTVRQIPDPQEEESKTCDGQMAKSLVKANDDMLQAQRERDVASKGMKEKETSNIRLEQELKEIKTSMTAKLEKLEEQLEQTKKDSAKKVEQVTKKGQEQVAKAEASAKETIATSQEEKKDLEALKESEIEGLQGILNKQEQKLIAKSDAKLQVYKTEMEAKIEGFALKLESQEQKEKKSVQAAVAKMEEEKIAAVAKVEEEKTAAVKALEQEKEALAKENAKINKFLEKQTAGFESQKKKLERESKNLKDKSAKAIKDVEHWENLHATRSYCNVTHLTEDVSAVAMVYTGKAADKLREFKETASVSARKLQVETVRLTKENMEKSKKLAQEVMVNARPYYEKSLKPHVDKAVEAVKPYVDQATAATKPHVDKVIVATKPYVEKAAVVADETIFPLLVQAKEEAIVAMEIADKKAQETFNKVVAIYADECPKASASVKNFAKEKNFELPVSMLHSMDSSCQQPRESVSMALYIVGAIFFLLFRKALVRWVKWLILLPIRILWFFNPLRFCFGSKKKTVPVPTTTKAVPPSRATPVGIKKKQRNNASATGVSQ